MIKTRKLVRGLRAALGADASKRGEWAAILGLPDGSLVSSEYDGFVYARLYSGEALLVWNSKVPTVWGLEVVIGYADVMPGVIQVLRTRFPVAFEPGAATIHGHHKSHEYPATDSIWVDGAQVMPLNVLPSSGFVVNIWGGVLRVGGGWVEVADQQVNLSAYKPGEAAKYVLIQVESDGSVSVKAGTEKDGKLTLGDIPEPDADCMGIAAVKLYGGQEMVRRDNVINDICDLRWGTASSAVLNGVTNGNSHDHHGGDGAQIDHVNLANKGTNTHSQIDSHLGSTSNPHSVTAAQAGAVPNDGWVAASGTWSYKSATEIYASGDWSGTLQKGDRAKFVQTTTKFMVVTAVSAYDSGNDRTTLTVTGGTDYTVANAAISSPYWSRFPKPSGWPDSFNWTPTLSASGSMTITNVTVTIAKFQIVGSELRFWLDLEFDTEGTAALSVFSTLPVTSSIASSAFVAACRDGSTGAVPIGVGIIGTTNGATWRKADGTNWSIGIDRRVYGFGNTMF